MMSITEYAAHRGQDRRTVRRRIQSGKISAAVVDGKIDPVVADKLWPLKGTAGSHQIATPSPKAADYYDSRARHETAKAELAELRLAEERGELVRRQAVADLLFTASRQARERLFAVAAQTGPLVAAESDTVECARIIGDAIQDALEEMVPEEYREG